MISHKVSQLQVDSYSAAIWGGGAEYVCEWVESLEM